MRNFAMAAEKMEMTQEMMGDAVDGALDADGEEEEADDLVAQVMAELKINMAGSIPSAPAGALGGGAAAVAPEPARVATTAGEGESLASRMAGLRGNGGKPPGSG